MRTDANDSWLTRALARPEPEDRMARRILDAALEQFTLLGLRRSSVDDVAKRACVSRVTVYRTRGGSFFKRLRRQVVARVGVAGEARTGSLSTELRRSAIAGRSVPVPPSRGQCRRPAVGGSGQRTSSVARRSIRRPSCQVPSGPRSYCRMTPTGRKPTLV
ncbi:hypothetical protein ACVW19_006215 [Streptomyces sp. TE5632]